MDTRRVQEPGPSIIEYKSVGGVRLHLHLFAPDRARFPGARPAILLFFGGGFVNGHPEVLYPQCRHFASKGFVAVSAEYRIRKLHGSNPFDSVEDGIAAFRWLRDHADGLGIDPVRMVGGGGSAGGHVSLAAAIFGERLAAVPLAVPDALVLFNPVLDTTETGYVQGVPLFEGREKELSPAHHVRNGLPPTLILHGTADTVSPYENAERFRQRMEACGNRCELVPYEGRTHGFFNTHLPQGSEADYSSTLREAERFLSELGYSFISDCGP